MTEMWGLVGSARPYISKTMNLVNGKPWPMRRRQPSPGWWRLGHQAASCVWRLCMTSSSQTGLGNNNNDYSGSSHGGHYYSSKYLLILSEGAGHFPTFDIRLGPLTCFGEWPEH